MTTTSWVEYEVRYRDNTDSDHFEDSLDVAEWMARPEIAALGPLPFRRTVTKTIETSAWEFVRDALGATE